MSLTEVINQMAEDRSNNWADEIVTLTEAETALAAALAELETYRANVGPIDDIVTLSRYARLGQNVAANIGTALAWDDCDEYITDFAAFATRIGLPDPGSADSLVFYRKLADTVGVDYDTEDAEDDDSDTCDAEGCDESLADGEGYDGYCGTHADQREADGIYSGEDVPA
jgi:hypothetical protein